jgi:hypothetical protein
VAAEEAGPLQRCAREIGVDDGRVVELALAQTSPAERGPGHSGGVQRDVAQIAVIEAGALELGPVETGEDEMRPREVDVVE